MFNFKKSKSREKTRLYRTFDLNSERGSSQSRKEVFEVRKHQYSSRDMKGTAKRGNLFYFLNGSHHKPKIVTSKNLQLSNEGITLTKPIVIERKLLKCIDGYIKKDWILKDSKREFLKIRFLFESLSSNSAFQEKDLPQSFVSVADLESQMYKAIEFLDFDCKKNSKDSLSSFDNLLSTFGSLIK